MVEKKIKKISYKTKDLVPDLPETVEIDVAGKTYTARCPNDYEFYVLYTELGKYSDSLLAGDSVVPVTELLVSVFSLEDARDLHKRLRGEEAKVDLFADLLPALEAIFDHYEPLIKARQAVIQKQMKAPKGS